MKHFKILYIIAAVVLVAVVWTASYINVNKRFPQPEEEIYEKGEWVEISDGVRVKGTGIEFCSYEEYRERYNIKSDSRISNLSYILVHTNINNTSSKAVNAWDIDTTTNLAIYPAGYSNQGMIAEQDTIVQPGESKDITFVYNVTNALIQPGKREKVLSENIYLCFKAYPVRQAIVFRGIDIKNVI